MREISPAAEIAVTRSMMLFFRVPSSKVLDSGGRFQEIPDAGFSSKTSGPNACRPGGQSQDSGHVMPDATIHTHGRVLETRGPVLYRVSLPNGKVILAHLSKRLADGGITFCVGDELLLEFTPYDFDTARILDRAGCGAPLFADAETAEDHA